ncbi:MAG: MFS transporter [Candidatus Dormibacteraeota bacterium]|nr:MFS transporter [Candidatus Dormibacteraeota bacterium]
MTAKKLDRVEEVEAVEEANQVSGRAALGVTGESSTEAFWSELRRNHLTVYTMVALGLLVIVDQFQLAAYVVQGPEISRALGAPRGVIALLVAVQGLALTLAALPIAALVQAKPRRALVAKVTGLSWSVATLFTGLVTGAWQLAGVMVVDGATSGSVTAIHQPLLLDSYPTSLRARVISGYRAFFEAGSIAAPLYVALLTGVFLLTWRGVFLVMGLTAVAVSLVGLWLRDPGFGRWDEAKLREQVRATQEGTDDVPGVEEYQLRFFEITRRLLLIPTVRRVLLANAILGMLLVPLNSYFVFFLEERWGLSPDKRALFFAALPVFSIALIVVFSRFNEALFRSNPARLFRVAALVQFAGLCLVGVALLMPTFWAMFLAFGLAVGCFALLTPMIQTGYLSIIRAHMRPHAAALSGVFIYGVGGVVGAVLLGGLDVRYGVIGSVLAVLAVGVFSSLALNSAGLHIRADLDRTVSELVEEEQLHGMARAGVRLPMLACRNLDFSYGQLQVLFGVDFTVDDGEMVALLGTNGAGKSTLLRLVSGLGLPSRGTVRFRGAEITYLDAERRVNLGITQVPGGRAVFGSLTVIENLRVFGSALGGGRRELDRAVDEAMAAFPRLGERRNQSASTLSGGEQQMLGLSKALILRPRLLLIDELSLGLAPKVVSELMEMVRRINSGGTAVVLVEQSVNFALSLVEHAYFMERGQVRFDGPAAELLQHTELLRAVFLEGAGKVLQGSA